MYIIQPDKPDELDALDQTRRGREGVTLPGLAADLGGDAVSKGHGRGRKDATSLGHNRGKWASLSLDFASFWGEY